MASQAVQKWIARALVLSALVVLAAVTNVAAPALAQAPARPFAAPTGAASLFGIDDGGVLAYNPTTRALAAGTGVYWERISLYWSSLEPTKGNYNFTSADAVIPPLLAAGFSPIVYLEMNPAWASNTTCGPVNDVQAFADMLGALAARYPDVKVWATYNEVDFDYANVSHNTGGCFGSRTNGGVNNNGVKDYIEYAQMLAAAWKAVHTANPNALLASGAIAYDNFNISTAPPGYPGGGNGGLFNYEFAGDLFKYMKNNPLPNGEKYMDMLLFNYYNIYGPYWQTKASGFGIQAKTKVLRKLMSDNGIEVVPLFITETGADSSPLTEDGVGDLGQARCLTMTMVRGAAIQLAGITWWTFRDHGAPHTEWDYGIVDENLNPKPSYTALKTIVAELNGVDFSKTKTNKTGFKGLESYLFVGSGAKKFVVWGTPNKPKEDWKPECSWPRYTNKATFKAKTLRVVNYLGKVKNIKDNSKKDLDPAVGSIAIKVGADPVIVQLNP